jgi:hypothetical protein
MGHLFIRPGEPAGAESENGTPVGAFLGTGATSLDRADAMEQWLGLRLDVQTVFEPWDADPEAIARQVDRLTAIRDAGRTPLVTWEAYTPTPAATPPDLLRRILAGEYDRYITAWGRALAAWLAGRDGASNASTGEDRRVLLRPLHEPNGDWYPWAPAANAADPALYARVWRRLHRRLNRELDRAGVARDRLTWIWAVNHVDVGGVPAESVFPGDDVVDLVGVDGFNWGASRPWSRWTEPEAVFDEMLDRVREVSTRPVCVPEFGCTSATLDGSVPQRKGEWLRDAFSYFTDQGLALAAYFDIEKETDWQVFGGSGGGNTIRIGGRRYHTYPGFRRGIRAFADPSLDEE